MKEFKTLAQYLEESGHADAAIHTRNLGTALRKTGELPSKLGLEITDGKKGGVKEEDILVQIAGEYLIKPHTQELLTSVWQRFWELAASRANVDVEIPALEITEEEIKEIENSGDVLYFVPDNISLEDLGKMFPVIGSHWSVQKSSAVTVASSHKGWRRAEFDLESSHLKTNEDDLEKLFAEKGREGLDLMEFIILREFSKITRGHYLNETETTSRLLSSCIGGRVVGARSGSGGYLGVASGLTPGFRGSSIGGRSSAGVQ
ncbi:hypothetical protein A2W45_03165 [Candidatus Curtissbacteria bacterium RIFCSPHIGHO2_12_41_11]|uniref:Uncharacterized protein n=3 Tax=Candidatus Curtissiibacteriota TaxID=1752717 RepID=A0A1F5HPV7_9BACT|nr:MAG: hypothetical protein UU56_C0017G0036 [Candidatus Curtissbacteria bacterium GW2011_GWA2_41_24]OGD89649.1 MAG: hypothetical protein A2Z54_00425 [Candidatus Curtissbacteria bacterium RIFCSPHIGHO2_02_39_8]OGD98228.1 MAG: hypothetical protein A2W45_03165 [Candidatus Curtissbacteria bacterium RIFCSPHIGHO2_12_41_11]OGE06009.1 MAG: hypothetical protein A2W70_00425 [Candidatus Curtissbacteria bacterium RIFCSPLOWO2_02_41_11]